MHQRNAKWEVQQRLEEIDHRLHWTGSVGRGELIERFGISPQQASADLKTYLALAGGTVSFNGSTRRYEPAAGFAPRFIQGTLDEYETWSGATGRPFATPPIPLRRISPEILCGVTRAIHQARSIAIHYHSLTHPEGTPRRITPHTIIFNGSRHHLRAYCHQRQGFRDFVLGRIAAVAELGEPGLGKERDEAWHTLTVARIGPHPGLSEAQRRVIEMDFAMERGEARVTVRLALLLYFLDQLGLNGNERERPPEEQQVVLLNPEIRGLIG